MKTTETSEQSYLEAKVGAFVLGLSLLGIAIVLLLSAKKHVFETNVELHAQFSDVQGLTDGAPVRLSGVNIGTVSTISFAPTTPGKLQVQITLSVSRGALQRIGTDAIARIDSQGLLGDKIVVITPGIVSDRPLEAGATIKTSDPVDINKMMADAAAAIDRIKHVADGAAQVLDSVADDKTRDSLRSSLNSVQNLLRAAVTGEGLAHAVFYDRSTAVSFERLISQVNALVGQVGSAVQHVDTVLGTTDGEGRQLLNNLSRASKSIGAVAGDVHDSHVIANLERASQDVVQLTAHARAGEGSLGALLMDPTAYEQLVTILGGVQRSRILRAVVRYAISKGEGAKQVGRTVEAP